VTQPAATIYQLRVSLLESTPAIWRQMQVRSDVSLYRLHRILQVVMGWTNSHLYQFIVNRRMYGQPDPEFGMDITNAQRVKLGEVVPRQGRKFTYEYDFGDCWEHQLVVEAILPAAPGVHYPVCLAGARACPPEDCGGSPGYEHLLEVLQNPQDAEYEELLEWVGGPFDPEAFDVETVNRQLRRMR